MINKDIAWINTYLGKKFFPLSPSKKDIAIEDIAHSLSRICRFNGHVNCEHYSVAQHCVLVSLNCKEEDAFHGLLHDASEAYLVDLAQPLKRSGEFDNFKSYENQLQAMIYSKFDLNEVEPPSVKEADIRMLCTEARDLIVTIHPDWNFPAQPYDFTIEPLGPNKAKEMFLARYKELYENK